LGSGLRSVGAALRQVSAHFAASVVANIAVTVLSLPVLFVLGIVAFGAGSASTIALGVAVIIGVLPNPMMCGLQLLARELAHGEIIMFSDQWDGLRQYWAVALRAWLVSLPVTGLLVANIVFYASGPLPRVLAAPLTLIWLYLLFFWLTMHLYIFPLLMEQEVQRVLLAYRNALVIVVSRPGFTLGVVPVWLALLLLSSVTGLAAIIGFAVGAAIQQNATARLLPTFSRAPQQ
jgi:hypothetical protein